LGGGKGWVAVWRSLGDVLIPTNNCNDNDKDGNHRDAQRVRSERERLGKYTIRQATSGHVLSC
jgi:hypothetical protein